MKTGILLLTIFVLSLFVFNVQAIADYIDKPTPSDESTDISYNVNVTTCIEVGSVPQGCDIDLFFYENSSGSWVLYNNYSSVTAKGYCGNFSVNCGTTYWWKVAGFINCSGGANTWWENQTYSFTTSDCPVARVTPINGSTLDCPCCLSICAKLSNLTGSTVSFTFQSNYSGSWSNLEPIRKGEPANETYCMCVPEFVWYNYTYYWRVEYVDADGTNYSDIYHFTTAISEEDCPCGVGVNDILIYPEYGILGIIGLFGLVIVLFYKKKQNGGEKIDDLE